MTSKLFQYVFGPVLSRRLGRSLGVDPVPFKTCTYDCVYCQLGPTTRRTLERREYVALEALLDEIRRKCDAGLEADYVTIAGSGEPLLYSRLGALIRGIKAMTSVPVAVITNGSLFALPETREDVRDADLLVPSLDAATPETFAAVNRPESGLDFHAMVEGLVRLRDDYPGAIWLEIFLVAAVTATDAEIRAFRPLIELIRPDKIQLNTVARPSPGSAVDPVPPHEMERLAALFVPKAEIIAAYDAPSAGQSGTIAAEDVLAIVKRHPATVEDIARGAGADPANVARIVAALIERGALRPDPSGRGVIHASPEDSG